MKEFSIDTSILSRKYILIFLCVTQIVVEEDWISQAIAHLVEEERLVVQRMGAVALATLFSEPLVAPELRSKKYVGI